MDISVKIKEYLSQYLTYNLSIPRTHQTIKSLNWTKHTYPVSISTLSHYVTVRLWPVGNTDGPRVSIPCVCLHFYFASFECDVTFAFRTQHSNGKIKSCYCAQLNKTLTLKILFFLQQRQPCII